MNIFFHREYRVQTTLRVPLPHFMLHRVIGTIATPVSIQTEPAAGVAPKSLVFNQKSPLRSLRPLRFHFSILYPTLREICVKIRVIRGTIPPSLSKQSYYLSLSVFKGLPIRSTTSIKKPLMRADSTLSPR